MKENKKGKSISDLIEEYKNNIKEAYLIKKNEVYNAIKNFKNKIKDTYDKFDNFFANFFDWFSKLKFP